MSHAVVCDRIAVRPRHKEELLRERDQILRRLKQRGRAVDTPPDPDEEH